MNIFFIIKVKILVLIKLTIKPWIIFTFWACDLVSFKQVSFGYPFLEPHPITYHSNTCVQLRQVTERDKFTLSSYMMVSFQKRIHDGSLHMSMSMSSYTNEDMWYHPHAVSSLLWLSRFRLSQILEKIRIKTHMNHNNKARFKYLLKDSYKLLYIYIYTFEGQDRSKQSLNAHQILLRIHNTTGTSCM